MINYTYVKNGSITKGRCSHVCVRYTARETKIILTDDRDREIETLDVGQQYQHNAVSSFNCDRFALNA